MRFAVPGKVRSDDCPPVATDTAPSPGTALRLSATSRAMVHPRCWPGPQPVGVAHTDPYVRRYWTAAIGAAAVADLLKLMAAMNADRCIKHPLYLHVLTAEGLVLRFGQVVLVRPTVPHLSPRHLRTLPMWLQKEHADHLENRDG